MFIDYPNLKVAWLDTMLLSLPEKPRTNGYTDWSNDIRPWNLLAEKYDRKIVMTHHCNKQGESPKDSLLGSVGIGASFEDILVIQKEGGGATLYTDGKDLEEKTYELEKLKYGWKVKDIIDPRYMGLGDTEKWVIDLLRNDPHKNQTELRTKSANKGREINERQMNDIITKLFDNHLIDSNIGKKRGAMYFSLI